jgi:HPt (histidine-containing phosphotransfer) domain-containing protein
MAALPLSADRVAAAIEVSFGSDEALYRMFEADCRAQFGRDVDAGTSALAAGDLAALGSLAHNLRSALVLLGHLDLSQLASQVEQHTQAGGERQRLASSWRALSVALRELSTD